MTTESNGRRPPQIPAPRATFPDRAEEDVPWVRRTGGRRPATSRQRRIVRDLPGWDPLPPGENRVHRRARD